METGAGLTDGAWHTVRLAVAPGRTALCLSVDRDEECDPPRPGPSVRNPGAGSGTSARLEGVEALLTRLNLTDRVRAGGGLAGCLREGPGLRFTQEQVESHGVRWGSHCLLPPSCQGRYTTELLPQRVANQLISSNYL